MSDPDDGADERSSNRELAWLLIGALVAGSMIALAIVYAAGAGR